MKTPFLVRFFFRKIRESKTKKCKTPKDHSWMKNKCPNEDTFFVNGTKGKTWIPKTTIRNPNSRVLIGGKENSENFQRPVSDNRRTADTRTI